MGPFKFVYFGLTQFTVNIRYIRHRRTTLYFFYRKRYFLHILALVFRTCFANGQDGIKNLRKLPCDVSEVFVQYYTTVAYLDLI